VSERGIVESVAGGIAVVRLTRNEACGRCGVCACGSVPETMVLRAYAPEGTAPGDAVEVEVDRGARGRAQVWLLAVPLAAFLGLAYVGRSVVRLGEISALALGLGGMTCAFVLAWWLDKRCGWSERPVARIVRGGAGCSS